MTDVIINDAENTPAEKADTAVDAGVKVAEQIIETAHTLSAAGDNRLIDLLHDSISRLNNIAEKLDGIDDRLNRVEMQVINNTITVENAIDDLEEVADDIEEVTEEVTEEVAEEVAEEVIDAVEKVDAPAVKVTETVDVREQPKKKKRIWL